MASASIDELLGGPDDDEEDFNEGFPIDEEDKNSTVEDDEDDPLKDEVGKLSLVLYHCIPILKPICLLYKFDFFLTLIFLTGCQNERSGTYSCPNCAIAAAATAHRRLCIRKDEKREDGATPRSSSQIY